MFKKILKYKLKIIGLKIKAFVVASLLFAIGLSCLFIYVSLGPRDISFLSPYIEKEINSRSSEFSVEIDRSYIKWNEYSKSLSFLVTNVDLFSSTNDHIATLPEVEFDFSILRLLQGNILSSDITLMSPSLRIDSASQNLYVEAESKDGMKSNLLRRITKVLLKKKARLPIESITVMNAKVHISTELSDVLWVVEKAKISLKPYAGKNAILAKFTLRSGVSRSIITLMLQGDDAGNILTNMQFRNVAPFLLSDIIPKYHVLERIRANISGDISFWVSPAFELFDVKYSLASKKIELDFPESFNVPLKLSATELNGSASGDFSMVLVDKFKAKLDKAHISGSGDMSWDKDNKLPNIIADAKVTNMPINSLQNYWPSTLRPKLRKWITTNIYDGKIVEAKGEFAISSQDIKNTIDKALAVKNGYEQASKMPVISKDSINAVIRIEGASVNFHPDYPNINNIKGDVHFDGHAMRANIKSASTGKSKVSSGVVAIPYMWNRPIPLEIEGEVDGLASDFIEFARPVLNKKGSSQFVKSILQMTGEARGKLKMSFLAKKKIRYQDFDMHIDAELNDSKLPQFFSGHDLTTKKLKLRLNNNKLFASGLVNVNGRQIEAKLDKNLVVQKNIDMKYNLKGLFSPQYIAQLNIAQLPFVYGDFLLDLDVTKKQNGDHLMTGDADLAVAEIDIPKAAFHKAIGRGAIGKFTIKKPKDKAMNVQKFSLNGDDNLSVQGSAIIGDDFSGLAKLELTNFKHFRNDVKVSFSKSDSIKLDVKGSVLDLSRAKMKELFSPDQEDEKEGLDLKIDLDVKTVLMKNDEYINQSKGEFYCDKTGCQKINFSGKLPGDKYIAASLKPLKNNLALFVESDDAGAVIRAFNLSKNINEGHLHVQSVLSPGLHRGDIKIDNFKAVRTPLLGRLLTLASFKGFVDLLNNSGISFQEASVPFEIQSGVITIKKARTSGSSVGITADGTINTKTGEVDIKGSVAPAYEINKAVGNIPVIGNIITGGNKESLIAANYRARGNIDDVKVTVNPLTILTPGFLRNIFK